VADIRVGQVYEVRENHKPLRRVVVVYAEQTRIGLRNEQTKRLSYARPSRVRSWVLAEDTNAEVAAAMREIPERRAIAAWIMCALDPPNTLVHQLIAGILSGEPVAAAARGELDEVLGRLPK
jgi:hypothetical protein